MKAFRIEKAGEGFANFCMALNIRFAYSYGTFFVFGTSDADKFRAYCKGNGFSKWESIEITSCDFEAEF